MLLMKGPRSERPLECFQDGGDLLVMPEGWGHATLNTKQSIGLAKEFGGWSVFAQHTRERTELYQPITAAQEEGARTALHSVKAEL